MDQEALFTPNEHQKTDQDGPNEASGPQALEAPGQPFSYGGTATNFSDKPYDGSDEEIKRTILDRRADGLIEGLRAVFGGGNCLICCEIFLGRTRRGVLRTIGQNWQGVDASRLIGCDGDLPLKAVGHRGHLLNTLEVAWLESVGGKQTSQLCATPRSYRPALRPFDHPLAAFDAIMFILSEIRVCPLDTTRLVHSHPFRTP